MTEFDPRSLAFVEDPYPFYARLRSEDPVHFVQATGMWWATRYDDVSPNTFIRGLRSLPVRC